MKRRHFLEYLGLGTAAAAVEITGREETAKTIADGPPSIPPYAEIPEPADEQNVYFGDMHEYLDIDLNNSVIDVSVPNGYDAVSIRNIYLAIQDIFDEPSHMEYSIPMIASAPMQYVIINGWRLTKQSYDKLAGGSLKLADESVRRTHISGVYGVKNNH